MITALNASPGAVHRQVPGFEVVEIEGVGHWLQLDAPQRINALLDAFLARLR
ncbi:MAG: alpha/beta fold hydrolase [Myxococcales bacterium]